MSNISKPKEDLRVTKTHRLLSQSLFTLINKKPFSKITVNDICELAMVSRATFYAHFEDKYHLLKYYFDILIEEFESECKNDFGVLEKVVVHIRTYPKMYKNLFFKEGHNELVSMLLVITAKNFKQKLTDLETQGKKIKLSHDVLANFYSGGIANLIQWWVNENFPISDEEFIEDIMTIAKAPILTLDN